MSLPPLTAQEIQEALSLRDKSTNNCLGSGVFSVVYEHPSRPDCAVKFSSRATDGGVLYAFWARANQGLAGVPEILHIEQVPGGESTLTVIVMKRYDDLIRDARGFTSRYYQARLGSVYNTAWQAFNIGVIDRDATPEVAELCRTLVEIRDFFRGAIGFDLHDENVMVDRAEGKLIVIDPLSFVYQGSEEIKNVRNALHINE